MSSLSAAGIFEGGAVEKYFEIPPRAELVIKGSFFSLDITGYDGEMIGGRVVMSERISKRNAVTIVTKDTPDQAIVEVVTNDRSVLRSSMVWYPQIRLRVPNGVSVSVTAAGDLVLQDLRAPKADLYTFEGDIIVRTVTAELFTTNAAGATRIFDSHGNKLLVSSDGDINLDTSTGDVRVQTINGQVTLRGVTGDIITNVPVAELQVDELEGVITYIPRR